jgi:uncharacterized protein YbjT (DUF2867 family)
MAQKKIIAVVGATGAQGGSLARAILADPEGGFAVRVLTRKPGSAKAQELAKLGAEVVQADLDDAASLERAFAGAYGAFCLTNFWEHFSAEKEVAQARNMAQAAKAAGLRHLVWSTLEDTRKWVPLSDPRMPTLQGKYKVPHFDGKGEADAVFQGLPTTYLATSFYWDNFIHFGMGPKKGADGRLGIAFPLGDKKLPGIAAEDIGKAAYGVFQRGRELIGKTVGIAGEHVSGKEMAAAFARALRQEVVYHDVTPETYRAFGFPGADDLGNMFQFKRDFNDEFRKSRDVEATRQLNPALKSFERWLAEHRTEISHSLEKA